MRRAGAVVALVAAFLVAPVPAGAGHFGPGAFKPHAQLWVGNLSQRGVLYRHTARFCGYLDCVVMPCYECPPRFRSTPLAVGAGSHRAKVVLSNRPEPWFVEVKYWSELDQDGHPVGSPTPIDWTLHERYGRRWRIRFQTPVLPPDAYIAVTARWHDGANLERASWGYHLAE